MADGGEDVSQRVLSAVGRGDLETVRDLLDHHGLTYSEEWDEGFVLLNDALKDDHRSIAILLLEKDCKVNSKTSGSITPLHMAVCDGDMEIMEMLLDRGANLDAYDEFGNTPLHVALERANEELLDFRVSKFKISFSNVTEEATSKHSSDRSGFKYPRIVEKLLLSGADVNSKLDTTTLDGPFGPGYTPLHCAVQIPSVQIVNLLLDHDAFVDAKAKHQVTPLHVAATNSLVELAEILVSRGAADVNLACSLPNKNGYTPLHLASECGSVELVKFLLSKGADTDALTSDGLTPADVAAEKGLDEIVRLLSSTDAALNVDVQADRVKFVKH